MSWLLHHELRPTGKESIWTCIKLHWMLGRSLVLTVFAAESLMHWTQPSGTGSQERPGGDPGVTSALNKTVSWIREIQFNQCSPTFLISFNVLLKDYSKEADER